MPGYAISPEADRDLDEQFDYYAERAGLQLALRFFEAAHLTFTMIATNPKIGRTRKLRDPELADVRWHPIAGFEVHLVFYRDTPEIIEIIRVLHGRHNLLELLG